MNDSIPNLRELRSRVEQAEKLYRKLAKCDCGTCQLAAANVVTALAASPGMTHADRLRVMRLLIDIDRERMAMFKAKIAEQQRQAEAN